MEVALLSRMIAAIEAEGQITTSTIQSVEDNLRGKGAREGIPKKVGIRDETLNNLSTALRGRLRLTDHADAH
ncbi:hypothetical protein VQH23_08795 [Pararoseomonas sp. SCSIO 73927]|uniref:hypothetical protein n=1 Tax=Pararoseomonas sp. SCSIO 73927 TaxID=3114537 RepID=UPI0030CB39EA